MAHRRLGENTGRFWRSTASAVDFVCRHLPGHRLERRHVLASMPRGSGPGVGHASLSGRRAHQNARGRIGIPPDTSADLGSGGASATGAGQTFVEQLDPALCGIVDNQSQCHFASPHQFGCPWPILDRTKKRSSRLGAFVQRWIAGCRQGKRMRLVLAGSIYFTIACSRHRLPASMTTFPLVADVRYCKHNEQLNRDNV